MSRSIHDPWSLSDYRKMERRAWEFQRKHREQAEGEATQERKEAQERAYRHQRRFEIQREEETAERAAEAEARKEEAEAIAAEKQAKEEEIEWRYTPRARQKIAQLNEANQRVMSDPKFSEEDRAKWQQLYEQQMAGIRRSPMPRDPNAPTFKPGREPGETWQDDAGNWMSSPADGSPPKLILRWDQSREAKELELQGRLALEEKKVETARSTERRKYLRELRTEKISALDEFGEKIPGTERYRDPREVYDEMRRAFPEFGAPEGAPSPEPIEPEAPPAEPQVIAQAAPPQAEPAAPPAEPPVVQQAREIVRTRGVGTTAGRTFISRLKAVGAAKKLIKDWESEQRGQKKHTTEREYNKLASGATYFFHGQPMRKP